MVGLILVMTELISLLDFVGLQKTTVIFFYIITTVGYYRVLITYNQQTCPTSRELFMINKDNLLFNAIPSLNEVICTINILESIQYPEKRLIYVLCHNPWDKIMSIICIYFLYTRIKETVWFISKGKHK